MRPGRTLLALLLLPGAGMIMGAGEAPHATEPVRLEVEHAEGKAIISVIGEARETVQVRFELAVEGGSKIRNASNATLAADAAPVTLSRAIIGDAQPWSARLTVRLGNGHSYVVTADGSVPAQ